MRPVHLLNTLERAGFSAYFVGGCVRDTLLGRPVNDWDMTTSATPEEIMALFLKTVPTGLKHGTVTVLDGSEHYEVTTFRCDGAYADSRHPRSVRFVRELGEDLSRRDFTVNAMAMDARGEITDLFGGREDLARGLLRCVGDPDTRFREDALRMLRALRFSAQLGFRVDDAAVEAMGRCAHLCARLSAERVRDEVEKTILSPAPETVHRMAKLGLLEAFGFAAGPSVTEPAPASRDACTMWAWLLRQYPGVTWQGLRLDKKTGQISSRAAQLARCRDRLGWKQVLAEFGLPTARCAAALAGQGSAVEEILRSGECVSLRDLAVGGGDFPGASGREVGAILDRLLAHVLAHPEDNTRDKLLQLAEESAQPGRKCPMK